MYDLVPFARPKTDSHKNPWQTLSAFIAEAGLPPDAGTIEVRVLEVLVIYAISNPAPQGTSL